MNDEQRLQPDPVLAGLIRPLLQGMAGRLDTLRGLDGAQFREPWTALLTMLLRSLTGQALEGVDLAAARRVQAQRYIRAHLADPGLSAGAVAAALQVSRRSLYAYLPGAAAYIRAQRLGRARELLADPTLPAARVAAIVGLPDPAHFSRLFRAEFGCSPRDARAHPNVEKPAITAAAHYARADTSVIAARDRFEYWRERVIPLRLEPIAAAPQDFRALGETVRSGDVGVIEMRRGPAVAAWRRAAAEQQGRLRLVLLAPAAGAAASWYDCTVPLDHGAAVLAGPHDGWWRAPAGMHGIEVDVPRGAVEVTDAELAHIQQRRLLGTDPVFTTLIRPMLLGMVGHLAPLATSAGSDLGTVWTSLIIMLVRSIAGQDLDGTDVTPARRVQAERFIRERLSDPRLSPAAVAAALSLSRRALYGSVFPEDGGVAAFIRRQRLARARQLLADTALPVARVAAMVGLSDPAQFSRLFRAEFGCTPRDARATATSRASRNHGAHAHPPERRPLPSMSVRMSALSRVGPL